MEQTQKTAAQNAGSKDSFLHLRERITHLQDDAKEMVNAVKHDYEEVKHAAQQLQADSELLSFLRKKGEEIGVISAKTGETMTTKTEKAEKPKAGRTASGEGSSQTGS